MDVTPSLVSGQPSIQGGQLVRFFGRFSHGSHEGLRIQDLLRPDKFVSVKLGVDCSVPEVAALVRITGSWAQYGIVEAYDIEVVEDTEALYSLQDKERLRLLELQASSAYKIARARAQQRSHTIS